MVSKTVQIFMVLVYSVTTIEYGPYRLEILEYELIQSPNTKDLLRAEYKTENVHSKWVASYFIVVKRPLGSLGIRIKVSSWNESNGRFVPLLDVVMKNACEKQLAKDILGLIPALGEKCLIKTGEYNFTIGDFEKFTYALTNGKFYFGKYLVLTDILAGKHGRCLRSNVTVAINPVN